MLLQTGLSNDVDSIKIEEYFDCEDQANTTTLDIIGFGGDPWQGMADDSPALFYQRQYWFQMIQHMADSMGVELSRIEAASYSEAALVDLGRRPLPLRRAVPEAWRMNQLAM
ncbi:hypothetical protein AB4876_18885 [Zhongshania guokunii]|uniref:Uncharacterized protein n=1 Tax=Zhongshania guokunii TaxID=641783 RepID=A0ABV3UB73_9GAMM